MKLAQRRLGSAAVCALLLVGPGLTNASAQYRDGRTDRRASLEGRRFETMRSLAHFLDEGARFALDESTNALGNSRSRRDAAYLNALRSFAQHTDSFHERMDAYQANPWDVDSDVRQILMEARRVSARMRDVGAVSQLRDDWAAVVDDVSRMQQLLAGYDVQVPSAHPRWGRPDRNPEQSGEYDRSPDHERGGPPPDRYGDDRQARGAEFGDRGLAGEDLREFRQLARELDQRAQRAVNMADRGRRDDDERGRRTAWDLRHFAEQAASLHERTDAEAVNRREVGPVVGRLLEEARRADRAMRDANALADGGEEWPAALRLLQRMDEIVRR